MNERTPPTDVSERRVAALIGGTGFLGTSLDRELRAKGWEVFTISRGPRFGTEEGPDRGPIVTWNGESESLEAVFRERRPDVVIDLAAHYVGEHVAADIDALVDGNVRRPLHAMEAARAAGVDAMVTAGTLWEEMSDHDLAPVNLYAATRCAAKSGLTYFTAAFGWRSIHLRVSDLYGPSDPRRKLFHHVRSSALTGSALEMTEGLQELDLVYVDDAARAFCTAAAQCLTLSPGTYREYGVFSAQPVSLRRLLAHYEAVCGVSPPVVFGARQYRRREVMSPRYIDRLPGWAPQVSLDDGIRLMETAPGGLLSPR